MKQPGTIQVVVTGTDTDVGKTVFTACFMTWLRAQGIPSIGFKPLASGGREDAERLFAAQQGTVPLDVINPWHFPEPLAPLLAARRAGRRVTLAAVAGHVRMASRGLRMSVVESAGGLLSPLLEGADAPQLIASLKASPVVVAVDRLGVVGQVRLVWAALPEPSRRRAQVVLMSAARPDGSTETNCGLLAEYIGAERIHRFPWLTALELRSSGGGKVEAVCAAAASGLGL
jgi:dethiobiotin synthetase